MSFKKGKIGLDRRNPALDWAVKHLLLVKKSGRQVGVRYKMLFSSEIRKSQF
jgi:hypothetical protein